VQRGSEHRIECVLPFDPGAGGALPLAAFLGARSVGVISSDDWDSSSANASFDIRDAGPTRACATTTTKNACYCKCSFWEDETEQVCRTA
jgi:hypothetical protein